MIVIRHRTKLFPRLGGSVGAGRVQGKVGGKVSEWARGVLGFEADKRQAEVLDSGAEHLLLCCSRQWGKSTVAAVKALHVAMTRPGTRTLVVAPGGRQGHLFLEAVEPFLGRLKVRRKQGSRHRESLVFPNGSDIVAVPPRAETIRGFRNVSMVIVDEAAMVADEAYTAVGPARATTRGPLWLMSTPKGQGGYFYEAWAHGGKDWARYSVPATECQRISKEFLEWNRRQMGEREFRQEFLCEFVASGGQMIDREVVERLVSEKGRPVGEEWAGPGVKRPGVTYFVGVDLGMRRDPTAVAVLKREVRGTGKRDPYSLEHIFETVMTLERVEWVELKTPYAEVGGMLRGMLQRLPVGSRKVVAVDATGVGDPVVAQLKMAGLDGELKPVVITGGQSVGRLDYAQSVPKKALLNNLRRMMEEGVFTMKPGLSGREALTRELISMGVEGYGGHDDMALALGLACWVARAVGWVGERGDEIQAPIVPRYS